MLVYFYIDQPEDFVALDYITVGGVSVFLVWLTNKIFRWQADHFEVEECPWCGATLEWEEVQTNE